MPLKMRPATLADGPALGAVYLSAFSDNPVATTCFPSSSSECREFLSKAFAEEVSDPRAHVFVVTDPDHREDPDLVIAWAKWVRPAKEGEVNVESPPPKEVWPKEGNPEFASEFFGRIGRKHAAIVGDVRHWYLELIVCRKEHQGKGAATPLLRWGLEQADKEGSIAFLESMPKAKAVYEKYGFETVDYMEIQTPSGGTISQDFMLRGGKAPEDYMRVLENIKNLR
ncbi:GNAT family [Colletotrichum karsti]|uniref:GNAT family n=1 Tax=Colletotrichum karsti TaxID=1095194 RepID=A0A9P6I4M2_9PEZI|nr:GNAT family [Colletotrichum karsti]KAF9874931.1 GNAT family [Colletotrichum karsti]